MLKREARENGEDLESSSGRKDKEGWLKAKDALNRVMWRDGVQKITEGMR